ncbi:GNAT family N-acetyltransferase [Sporolactobacillus laevolacticus]|uniref:GNAT family N-acetyltransferase n=1 Tax=Sporolactobacillus laevolacticus TaxID=33018 RepID=UPI0025B50952|nr:GNAT family protein [Sporolactobacillus laevolacticus]MDN3954541.1 GNAT family protein [Sporolactobacillus laevolacticus]
MNYKFEVMTQEQAEDIAYNWHYDHDYSFYDMEADEEDLEEFLDPQKRNNSFYVVKSFNTIIGFFCFDKLSDHTIEIGLGMKPELTGKGHGYEFLKAGIDFAKSNYKPNTITLSVAAFNQRAIKVYQKIGFKEEYSFMQDTNGSSFKFLKMNYAC